MGWGSRTATRCACTAAVAVAAAALPAASSASPAAPVRVGSAPHAARDAKLLGAIAASVPLHLTVVLRPRDPSALAAYAQSVSSPGSSVFHQYLTSSRFAEQFGATPAQVQAVESSLRTHGLTPGPVSANRLSIPVSATAGQAERAFSLTMRRMTLPGGRRVTLPSAAPALDSSVADDVQAVLGVSSVNAFHPQYAHAILGGPNHPRVSHNIRHTATGGPQPCAEASAAASQQGGYTADQIAATYGFPALYQGGDQGQGETIAVYELESNDPRDIAAYQSCYGTHASVSYLRVDGGSGPGEGSGEAALDIENSIGLAPKASYLVYQGANSSSSGPGSGPYDTFNAIISQDRAQVVSVSWGECEAQNNDGIRAESTLFEEAATQGQSIVSASGDDGSEDCSGPPPNVPNPSLAVDDPSSQPFVTGVGGTTLSAPGPAPTESVWNNGTFAGLSGTGGAGGGGISQVWSMPTYQSGAPAGLHVVGPLSSGSPCATSTGSCRESPDVSADADPNTGYMVYWNGSQSDPASSAGWQAIGGTSAAAPVWAGLFALIDASSECHGSPLGFANPALYRAAAGPYRSDFNDVTSGNNDLSGAHGGLYPAGAGFDMASGLGTPVGGGLAPELCASTLRIVNPGARRSTAGRAASLQLRLSGQPQAAITWRASGLPPGLSISSLTGRLSGTPRRGGTYQVTVSGTYQDAPLARAAFTWTVISGPSISRLSLTGVAARRPTLSLTISRGFRAPPLRSVAVAVPAGLRFSSRKGALAITGAAGRSFRFSDRVIRGRLRIRFSSPQARVSLRIRYAGISTTPGLAGRVRGHRVRTLQVTVIATDTHRHGSTVIASVRPS